MNGHCNYPDCNRRTSYKFCADHAAYLRALERDEAARWRETQAYLDTRTRMNLATEQGRRTR